MTERSEQTALPSAPRACDCYPAVSEALGCLHVIRYTAKGIERWKYDPNFSVDDEANKIVAYGLKMHVLLGGNTPGTYGEACVMQDFPECEPHEWDNMTMDEQKAFLAERWGLAG